MSGCRDSATPGPETISLLREMPRATASPQDTCQTQREIAAQNSYIDTALDGVEKVYKAACDMRPEQRKPKPWGTPVS